MAHTTFLDFKTFNS